jgi:hypothetical protein
VELSKQKPLKKLPRLARKNSGHPLSNILKKMSPFLSQVKSRFSLKHFLLVIIVAALGYVFYRVRGQIIVATVNSRPVFRWTLLANLEKQAGGQVLEFLITERLVYQEAGKKGIKVTKDEIDKEISRIEESLGADSAKFDELLEMQGSSRKKLAEQI